jgi:hypothetical protein
MDKLPVVLQVENQEISLGRMGIITNNMAGFYIESFHTWTVECVKEPDLEPMRYLPPMNSRFRE